MLKRIAASAKTQYLTLERLPCWYDVWHLQGGALLSGIN